VHQDVGQALDNLASLYYTMKRYPDSEPLYRRSLAIWTQLLGPDHFMLATSLDNLAVILALEEKYDESEQLYLKALAIRDRDDLGSLHNLMLVEQALDKDTDALPLYKRMLAMLDTPEKEKSGASILQEYADLLRRMHRPREAALWQAKAKALSKK
jgi:tetratricopeptide (TPR) repeat protein